MMNEKTSLEYVLKNISIFLEDKSNILLYEIQQTIRDIRYIDKINKNQQNKNSIEMLAGISQTLNTDITNIIQKIRETKEEPVIQFIKFDNLKNNIKSLSIKLQDIRSGFKTMFGSIFINSEENSLNIYKRYDTINLQHYYNANLTKSLSYFFDYFKVSNNNKSIFITRTQYDEHVKQFFDMNDEPENYIAMGFWFFERPLAFPIASHEVAHLIYMKSDSEYRITKNEKLQRIIEDINISAFSNEEKFKLPKNFIFKVYQEIHCDLAAYSIHGISYFYALFFTTMLGHISQFFYKNHDEIVAKKEEFIGNNKVDMECLEWIKTPMNISLYVRFKVMIELIEKEIKKKEKKLEYELFDGIKDIVSMVYEDENTKLKSIKSYLAYKDYKILKTYNSVNNYTQFIFRLFKTHFLSDDFKVIKFEIKQLSNDSEQKKQIKYLSDWLQEDEKTKNVEILNTDSIHNICWKFRINKIKGDINNKEKNKDMIRRKTRFFAISTMLDFVPNKIKHDDCIYEMIEFNFMGDAYKDDTIINKIRDEMRDKDSESHYRFGVYELTTLYNGPAFDVDEKLNNLENVSFITKRSALFQLHENKSNLDNCKYFLSIKVIVNEVNKHKSFIEKSIEKLSDVMSLFKSMSEYDYLMYAKSETIEGFKNIFIFLDETEGISYEYTFGTKNIKEIASLFNKKELNIHMKLDKKIKQSDAIDTKRQGGYFNYKLKAKEKLIETNIFNFIKSNNPINFKIKDNIEF
jgi:hypothetical protein